jgi:hypothetical protein
MNEVITLRVIRQQKSNSWILNIMVILESNGVTTLGTNARAIVVNTHHLNTVAGIQFEKSGYRA